MTSLMPLLKGFSITLGLIIPIGAQNAFVLKRGIMRRHVLGTILTCMTIDAILITSGVMGFGALVMEMPVLMTICKWGGAVFLIFYGARSLRSAFQSNSMDLQHDDTRLSYRATILTIAALSLLNPHVYLDTVVLVGSISTQYTDEIPRILFTVGAVFASVFWFFSLGYGAALLTPFFQKPMAWKLLDGGVCIVMWTIAAMLLWPGTL